MRVAIGCDHAGIDYKEIVIATVKELGHDVADFGTVDRDSVDYPDFAEAVGDAVVSGRCDAGILICGTGIGMSMSANKITGIRCALCYESYSARMSREHNDANILALGSRTLGPEIVRDIVRVWMTTEFAGGRHQRRVDKIMSLQKGGDRR